MNKWKVLILCTGYTNTLLRSVIKDELENLGFEATVYDFPGYPVDPSIHSHADCVTAINQHDIVLAFADETEGGEFQIAQAPPEMIDKLRRDGILPLAGSTYSTPTIFQVEVLVAKALRKPTLVFIPKNVQAQVEQELKLLRERSLHLKAKTTSAPDQDTLIGQSNWEELDAYYEVPSGRIKSFGQVAFLERLRKEAPNFISFYEEEVARLRAEVQSRIAGVAEVLIKEHSRYVSDKIEKKRDLIATPSLRDLLDRGRIIAAPYNTTSSPSGLPLFSTNGTDAGELAKSVLDKKSILLLGNPGHGKTTASLLSFKDIVYAIRSGVEGYAPLFASWRDLYDILKMISDESLPLTGELFIRFLLALPYNREHWPQSIPLPNKQWILVLDGLDESYTEHSIIIDVIKTLSERAILIATCRKHDFERHLRQSGQYFNRVYELLPWDYSHIQEYIQALRNDGRNSAADFIEHLISEGNLPNFLSIPLWLSMLAFLGERASSATISNYHQLSDDYEILRTCSDAVAEDEINRHNIAGVDKDFLRESWGRVAWVLHIARREGRGVKVNDLEALIGFDQHSSKGRAVLSFLETIGVIVRGFFHEVFQEYWLAEYLVDQLVKENTAEKDIADLFRYQRSIVTNRLMRLRINTREDVSRISKRLREAFWAASGLADRVEFAKNQIIYLLGRIDTSPATKSFLSSIWNSSGEPPFVKYSAAYASIMQGDAKIESEYYNILSSSDSDDRINRGYHLYYYQDVDINESDMPWLDDNKDSAEDTLRNLFRRLSRVEDRYRNVHRIELFTLRRFLETGRTVPSDISDPESIINKVVQGAKNRHLSDEYVRGIEEEARKILQLLTP